KLFGIHPGLLVEDDAVHPVDASGPRPLCRKLQSRDVPEALSVLLGHPTLVCHRSVDPLELCDAERCLKVRETEVASHLVVEKSPSLSKAQVAIRAQTPGEDR